MERNQLLENEKNTALNKVPDFTLGTKALELFKKHVGEEQARYVSLAGKLAVKEFPNYDVFDGEVVPTIEAFKVLAEEVAKYVPIKNA